MTTVVFSAPRVVDHPKVGGHFWEYVQYAHAFRSIGCDVWWLERVDPAGDPRHGVDEPLDFRLDTFMRSIRQFGFADRLLLYQASDRSAPDGVAWTFLNVSPSQVRDVIRRADLLVNFDYQIDPAIPLLFRRSALIDTDPGLLQFWLHHRQIQLAPHDVYFTTGETVGTNSALFPDGGLEWVRIRPSLSFDLWPYVEEPGRDVVTSVSSWWADEWIYDGIEHYENNKRVTFLQFWDLPTQSGEPMELALSLGPGDVDDIARLRSGGWSVCHSGDVARTPRDFKAYIQSSRAEFSCVKPSCIRFANAWMSIRTLCYLASGRPAVVQDTGPSAVLPSGEGFFRFSTMEQAIEALREIRLDYRKHARAARELVEGAFDARVVASRIVNIALSRVAPSVSTLSSVAWEERQASGGVSV